MKSKFKKLMAAALVLCLMLALLPAGVPVSYTHLDVYKRQRPPPSVTAHPHQGAK